MRYAIVFLLLLPCTASADEAAEAAVAVELAKLKAKKPVAAAAAVVPAGYEMVSVDGGPWTLRKAAPAVAAQKTFHPGHSCPNCGRSQYAIAGYNADGTHNHSCSKCGTTWRH